MEYKAELDNLYGISSIWTTIRIFKPIIQDLIKDVVADSSVVERSITKEKQATADKEETTVVPAEEPLSVHADAGQKSTRHFLLVGGSN